MNFDNKFAEHLLKILYNLLKHNRINYKNIIKELKLDIASDNQKAVYIYVLLKLYKINNLRQNDINKKNINNNILRTVELLIKLNANINYVHPNSDTNLLMISIVINNISAMKMLIKNNIDLNFNTHASEISNALTTAIRFNNKDAFKILIENPNVNVNEVNNLGKNALFYAVSPDKIYYAVKLLNRCININQLDNTNSGVIKYAAENNNIALINCLVKNHVFDTDYLNDFNNNVIFRLMDLELYDIINILISNGLNVNNVNNKGEDLLYYAIKNNKKPIIDKLISLTTLNKKYENGETLLTYAIKNDLNEIAIKLINNGIDMFEKNNRYETAFTLTNNSFKHRDVYAVITDKFNDVSEFGNNLISDLEYNDLTLELNEEYFDDNNYEFNDLYSDYLKFKRNNNETL